MTQYHIFFIILIHSNPFVQLRAERTTNNSCPHLFKTLSDCTCAHPNTIDCSSSTTITQLPRSWRSTNDNLTSFTQSIFRFDLLHNPALTLLKTDDFQGLHQLRHLTIINTGLVSIRPHAFRHLSRLRELRIESNAQLVELNSFALSNIEHIHRISLVSNAIRVIHTEAFRNTHFVDILDLSDNPLEVIESNAFTGLKSVGRLILCVLPSCSIKQIDAHAFFGFHTCDTIQLTGIHTSLRSKSFTHMTAVRLLNLSHSDIVTIHSYAFQECEFIGEIDLSSSMISTIDANAFDQLQNVSLLNLNANLIRSFEKSIFQPLVNSIKEINLDNNPIQCDCTLEWYLEQRSDRFKLPDVCTGPIGYECLSPNELQQSQLPCHQLDDEHLNQTERKNLCEKRVKDVVAMKSSAWTYKLESSLFPCSSLLFFFLRKLLLPV